MEDEDTSNKKQKIEPVEFLCNICGKSQFTSRNKLFKHLKICKIDMNPQNVSFLPDLEFISTYDPLIFVSGGRLRGNTLSILEKFSFKENKWMKCSSMKENRGSHSSCYLNGFLYIVGGGGLKSNLSSMERYDSKMDSWESMSSMPTPRHALSVVTCSGFIFSIGGWIGGTLCSKDIEKYDPKSNIWTICQQMQIGRRLLGSCGYEGKIYVFGGNLKDGEWYSDALEIYDIEQDSWSYGKKMPVSGATNAVLIGDHIFVVVHGHFILRYSPKDNEYEQVTEDLPIPNWYGFDVVAANKKIYLLGGASNGQWKNSFYALDILDKTWKQMPGMNKNRRRCAASIALNSS